jgi:superfamily II DNA or RNA helicase
VLGPRLSLEQSLAATAAMRDLELDEPVPSPSGIEHIHPESMRPVLRIRRMRPRDWPDGNLPSSGVLAAVPVFGYGDGNDLGLPAEDEDPSMARLFHPGGLRVIHRRVEEETKALSALDHSGLVPVESWIPFANPPAPAFRGARWPERATERDAVAWAVWKAGPDAEALRQAGWSIEDAPDPGVKVLESAKETMRLDPWNNEGIDWFAFDLGVEAEGERVSLLPALAAAMQSHGDALLALEPGEEDHLMLPVEGDETRVIRFPFRRFVVVARQVVEWFGGIPKSGVRLHPMHAAELVATLGDQSELHGPDDVVSARLRQTGRALRGVGAEEPAPKPTGLQAELRPYQQEGFQWLQFLARNDLHGLLADDMGLGKTLQTISHLCAEIESGRADGRPSLVVAPTSVTSNWKNELRRFAPHLRVLMLTGPRRHRYFDSLADADVILTSYPLLQRDSEALAANEFHVVVLDEAQWIKNPGTRAAKAAFDLRARHRLALSGTPMENHLGELWSLFRFLMPGLLGSADEFRRFYRAPIEKSGDLRRQQALNRRVGPLILRRTKDKVASDLPPRTEVEHSIELLPAQADLYESVRATLDARVREAIASQGLDRAQILVLDAMLKLRQICCHPALLETNAAMGADSAKLDHLLDMLLELVPAGRRVLVFSQFTTMLAKIARRLEEEGMEYLELTGSSRDRESLVRKFQEGDIPVFLISLKAGGAGLNLTAADTVIHYDPWWNPAVEAQASDRAHRIGQTRPVFIHRLICRGTIEEKMQELKARKAGLVDALLAGSSTGFKLDQETIRELFAPVIMEE